MEPEEVSIENLLREGEIKGKTDDGVVLGYEGMEFSVNIDHPQL